MRYSQCLHVSVPYSMIPRRSIVLPLPGSPPIQRRRLLHLSCHFLNSSLSRIQQYETLSRPPLVSLIRSLSPQGSVARRARRHAWSGVSDCTKAVHYLVTHLWELCLQLTERDIPNITVYHSCLETRVHTVVKNGSCHDCSPEVLSEAVNPRLDLHSFPCIMG